MPKDSKNELSASAAAYPLADIGAKPGDKVRCTKLTTAPEWRFVVGRVYTVVDFCGGPHVAATTKVKIEGVDQHVPPFRGYGAEWELAA